MATLIPALAPTPRRHQISGCPRIRPARHYPLPASPSADATAALSVLLTLACLHRLRLLLFAILLVVELTRPSLLVRKQVQKNDKTMPAVLASGSATRQIQTPTCIQTRVRSTADAHKLFLAVQRGLLPLVRRRLDAEERLSLAPGNVYIWEERPASADGPGPAMERFTEGKRWSQSRVREVCNCCS